jgi:hypothetical protein
MSQFKLWLYAAVLGLSLLAGSPDAGRAQGCGSNNPNCIVPTAPLGTSDGRAASTKFVQNQIAAGLPLPNAEIYVGNVSGFAAAVVMSGDATISNTGAIAVNKTGGVAFGTMATQNASSVAISGGSITGLPAPANPADAATKSYVDATSAGLTILAPSGLATAAVLPNTPTYNNGASGVGATLTAGSNSTLTVDGTVAALGAVVLVNNQASAFQNGIYTVTTAGSGAAAWVLTRATYFNQSSNMLKGSYTFITGGVANASTSWVLAATTTTVGTTAVNFNQFSQATAATGVTYLAPGTGAVSRTVQAKLTDFISVADFGAIDDNSTDNTPKIQAAINQAQTHGRTLYFPLNSTGVYLLNTAFNSVAVLSITSPIRMVCEAGVWLKPSSSITNGQSILYFTAPTTAEIVQTRVIVDGCNIGDPAATTRFGNHGIVFDTTAGGTSQFAQPVVQNIKVTYSNINSHACINNVTIAGCAIFVNNIATNTSGGTYGAVFQNSMLNGGVNLLNAGDSNALINVFFAPDLTDANASNQGVYASLITGAGVLLLDNINCQVLHGCLIVDNAASVEVKNSNFEQISTNVENNNSMIDLGSSIIIASAGVGAVHIIGGSIVSSDCTNHPFLITFNKVGGAFFDALRLGMNCPSYPHALVQMTSNSSFIGIGAGNTCFNNGATTACIAGFEYVNSGTNNYKVTTGVP